MFIVSGEGCTCNVTHGPLYDTNRLSYKVNPHGVICVRSRPILNRLILKKPLRQQVYRDRMPPKKKYVALFISHLDSCSKNCSKTCKLILMISDPYSVKARQIIDEVSYGPWNRPVSRWRSSTRWVSCFHLHVMTIVCYVCAED